MNSNDLYNAIGKLDDDILEQSERAEKHNGWLKWGTLVACFGLIVTVTMISVSSVTPSPDSDVPAPVVSKDNNEPTQPSREITINWDNVAVNESAGINAACRLYYDPALYNEEKWGETDIVSYYGWNLIPGYIPDGLTDDGSWGFLCQEKATGNIVEDTGHRGFWSDFREDGSPKKGFTISASKVGIIHCALLPVDEEHTTDFGGVPVTITHCSLPYGPFDPTQKAPNGLYNMPAGYYDVYVASFELDGVKYEVETKRLELEEIVKIVASVISK